MELKLEVLANAVTGLSGSLVRLTFTNCLESNSIIVQERREICVGLVETLLRRQLKSLSTYSKLVNLGVVLSLALASHSLR